MSISRAFIWVCFLLGTAVRADAKPKSPLVVCYGSGMGNPKPTHKPWDSIEVSCGTHAAPPARGTLMTAVPDSPSLPTIAARVARSEPDPHDQDISVYLDPIIDPAWLSWDPPAGEKVWYYPAVMILAGSSPKARAVPIASVSPRNLPPGTRREDVIMVVDSDGDGSVDVMVRFACEDGGRHCEIGCHEVWTREGRTWRREDRTCGD
jgi:hypothetical protein